MIFLTQTTRTEIGAVRAPSATARSTVQVGAVAQDPVGAREENRSLGVPKQRLLITQGI